jgi:hypothetical protein
VCSPEIEHDRAFDEALAEVALLHWEREHYKRRRTFTFMNLCEATTLKQSGEENAEGLDLVRRAFLVR